MQKIARDVIGHSRVVATARGLRALVTRWVRVRYVVAWLMAGFGSSLCVDAAPPLDHKSSNAAALKPEIRYIQAASASIYAGPGDEFYPTMQMQRGDAVEVYQRSGDGWLAIRPPQGSFNWLPASQGLLLPGGRVVEVTDKAAVAWIGTSLGTAKQYRWQIRLNHGEQLAVIGEQSIRDEASASKTLWYKITPPNGEYRWVQESATASENPVAGNQDAAEMAESASAAGSEAGSLSSGELGAEADDVRLASGEEVVGTSVAEANEAGVNQPAKRMQRVRDVSGAVSSQGQQNQLSAGNRWDSWHAMEYKNGSFSFPGIARMFGMQPAERVSATPAAYDPFDARNNMRPQRSPELEAESVAAGGQVAIDERSQAIGSSGLRPETSIVDNESRGWRDPRQLRLARQRGSSERSEAARTAFASETVGDAAGYVGGGVQTASGAGLDGSSLAGADAVGSGAILGSEVVPASANLNGGEQSSGRMADDGWYGIRQAPPVADATVVDRPLTLSHADLAEVQVRLSEIVAGPEPTWNLAPLADRTRYFIEHGSTAIERGEARLLLDRIDAFSKLAKRSSDLGMTQAAPVVQSAVTPAINNSSPLNAAAARWASPLGVTPSEAGESGVGSSNAPRFDATGWVVPVHGTTRDMPTHALTNDSGKIIVYLTPAPGVNLSRYQSQAVGVFGLRGYLPQLRANHIQVQRAVRLQ